ncbi:MAG: GNAT family N-acetyltransferase [Flavobacterium sp.]
MIQWKIKRFEALSLQELYSVLELRSEVFVVEQNCVYQDIDNKDQKAFHVLGYLHNELVAYARLFRAGDYFEQASIGRVVVSPKHRNKAFGHDLIKTSIEQIQLQFQTSAITISAQLYLKAFYESHGFVAQGETYLEDDIPHIQMRKIT